MSNTITRGRGRPSYDDSADAVLAAIQEVGQNSRAPRGVLLETLGWTEGWFDRVVNYAAENGWVRRVPGRGRPRYEALVNAG